ncbi:hypothetical protein [Epilithonimonas lactis]|uniref:Uncharacterized protein n=1 Tax=Epilithonimonas lactis TaxID=421072 RepID=A0A085BJP9_9FLAO|nr:hypothetical protein [Epilithonimonas lactis]KFC22694.1 hypothetical protein IO89_06480 [Epilithonimonas lactis]SEQ84664.1 hypothetical protein SAMN04488097_3210 [Epilithonimonas lactis]
MIESLSNKFLKLGIPVDQKKVTLDLTSISKLDDLFEIFEKHKFKFDVFDAQYPQISDEGAYFSYSFDKVWKMTLGNHGWSGGIYIIDKEVIINQLTNLTILENKIELKIRNVNFFKQFTEKSDSENFEMNGRLKEIHKLV